MTSTRIAILAYEGCLGTEVFGMADVLLVAAYVADAMGSHTQVKCTVHVIGVRAGDAALAGGINIQTKAPRGRYDLMVIPGLAVGRPRELLMKLAGLDREVAFIRKHFAKGGAVASICLGTFLLGEAGLIDGRRVTTAWLFDDVFARRYPGALRHSDQILVEDGAITTTGAVSSAFDLAMHLVRRLYGDAIARATANITLLQPPRASQAPYVDAQLLPASLPSFAQSVRGWLTARLNEPFDLQRLAHAFHISPRTLLRRIRQETGVTPLALLQRARVDKAKVLLTTTKWSTSRIVEAVGYADVATFSRLFSRLMGETPAKYRVRHKGHTTNPADIDTVEHLS